MQTIRGFAVLHIFLILAGLVRAEFVDVSSDQQLATALSNVTGGETIRLAPGDYGRVQVWGGRRIQVGSSNGPAPQTLTSPVTITSLEETAVVAGLDIRDSDFWRFSQLSVQPSAGSIAVDVTNSSDFHFTDSEVRFGDSAMWSSQDWLDNAGSGVYIRSGDRPVIRGNRLTSVDHGITIFHASSHAVVQDNLVDGIRGDAMRGLGDFGTFEYNTAKNFVDVDGNHDDCFQSWSLSDSGVVGEGTVEGTIVRGNICIAYEDENLPHRGTPQGVGMFDGDFRNWTIEDNVIATDHWHGITVFGAIDSTLQNNTAIDLNQSRPGPPWIRVSNDKDGSLAVNNTVRNNLVSSTSPRLPGNDYENNILLSFEDHDRWFKDWQNHDYAIKPTAPNPSVGARIVPEPGLQFGWILLGLIAVRQSRATRFHPRPHKATD